MFKVVLIDIDNTILDFNKSAKKAMQISMEKHGLVFKDDYFNTFTKINNLLWQDIEKGVITREQMLKRRFSDIFKALDIDADGAPVETDFRATLYSVAIPVDGAIQALEYLYDKYDLYCASNAPSNEQKKRLEKADMTKYFKGVFVSSEIGYKKPQKEFFERCIEKMNGVKKEQIILIGDSLTADIQGGKNAGITTVWYNHNKDLENPNIVPDYTIYDIRDVDIIL
jgi:2-haloacid dehalogenase